MGCSQYLHAGLPWLLSGCDAVGAGRPDPGPAAVLVCDVLLITRCREAGGSEGSGVNTWKRVLVFPLAAARPCLSLPPLPGPGCGGAQGPGAAAEQPGLGQSTAEQGFLGFWRWCFYLLGTGLCAQHHLRGACWSLAHSHLNKGAMDCGAGRWRKWCPAPRRVLAGAQKPEGSMSEWES